MINEMVGLQELLLENQNLLLDPRKAIFWKESKTLIVSDLHLGKAGHFRKSGIPIPAEVHHWDLKALDGLMLDYQAERVIFLGDLFHSDFNDEWIVFETWLEKYEGVKFLLVKGNHDILDNRVYESSRLVVEDQLIEGPFHFTHEEKASRLYNISGHVHPSIRIRGAARQGITLPCFYFAEKAALLPAFGKFTGNYKIKPEKGSRVFAVAEGQIIALMA